MAKIYVDLKLEKATYARFKRVKHLMEFQNDSDYSMSEFVDILLDTIGKNVVADINRLEKKAN